MASNSPTTTTIPKENESSISKPRDMTADEYADLVSKWQQAYYAWQSSCVTYHNMMMFHSFQQFMQQIPVLTTTNLLHMLSDNSRSAAPDPLAEIRNARLKIASIWRRFFAEVIDFAILHFLKILVVFALSHYFDFIDENRLTVTHMISSMLYDESFSFPIELICIELGYLVTSVAFESYCLTRYGATPGKRFCRLRVLKCEQLHMEENGDLTIEPGTMLNSAAAFTRTSFKSLMSTFLFPAVVVALMTSQHRQTSYDMAANAVVVELERRE